MKKILSAILTVASIAAIATTMAACGGEDNSGGAASYKTYTMEAEYTDLTGVLGGGHSNEASGVNMIYGNGTEEEKAAGWSNGYYVAFTHKEGVRLKFVFNASEAATGVTIVLRLGSEMGNLTFSPSEFDVKLNGESIEYTPLTISNSPTLGEMKFYDKTVATNAALKKGQNEITLTVLANSLVGGTTAGPIIDCVKVTAKSELTWTDKTENPAQRGEI